MNPDLMNFNCRDFSKLRDLSKLLILRSLQCTDITQREIHNRLLDLESRYVFLIVYDAILSYDSTREIFLVFFDL